VGIQTSLDELKAIPRLVGALRAADELAFEASRASGVRTVRVLANAIDGTDQVVAIAAIHALAQVFDSEADDVLSALLSSDRAFLREHAAWAFSSRLPRLDTIGRLIGAVVVGGFGGMLAQRTLQHWAASAAPNHVALALEGTLIGVQQVDARGRVIETLGLVRGPIATAVLARIAADSAEPESCRAAAIAGLGDRRADDSVVELVTNLAGGEGFLADIARLALIDLTANPASRAPWQTGLTVAQLFLHADIDPLLTRAGSGDNGGIATLLVRLGNALTTENGTVQRVITLSRGSAAAAVESLWDAGSTVHGHDYTSVPLLGEPTSMPTAWPFRVAVERGIRRILRAAGTVDVLHLRMADVGSLAAADVARDLGIPVVFTVAPDPHALIQQLDLAGKLTRENFGDIDEHEHYWFRARLVQRLAADAAHTVLFPRPSLAADMSELVGIDITAHPERHTIVPEGIDLKVVDAAVQEAAQLTPCPELEQLLKTLPPHRRGLPLIISVGRLHRVKGMATIVDAWVSGSLTNEPGSLRDRANLLIIGGDIANPSQDEREQLALIEAMIPRHQQAESGLLLPGHRPNDVVARWVAAARFGLPGLAAPGGIYVCGSIKEEFGIALLEAMAAGLMVVAPRGGGPATFVEEGVTGFLTATQDPLQLATAIRAALDAVAGEMTDTRATLSRQTVAESFTIEAMAAALSGIYVTVAETALAENSDNRTVTSR
jgi:glycosyltransferase involved in cell wall biosynthesis